MELDRWKDYLGDAVVPGLPSGQPIKDCPPLTVSNHTVDSIMITSQVSIVTSSKRSLSWSAGTGHFRGSCSPTAHYSSLFKTKLGVDVNINIFIRIFDSTKEDASYNVPDL